MKSKNSKAQINQARLLEEFLSAENLSIAKICEILSCNRQSAYNYIRRLENNGYSFHKKTQQNNTLYTLVKNNSSQDMLYRPLTADILRKYTIVHELQYGPIKKEDLRTMFTVYKPTENITLHKRIPLDIELTQYYNLIKNLIQNDEITLNPKEDSYYLTGKNIPLEITLDDAGLLDLNEELSTATSGTAYYEQIKSIYLKTCILLGNIDKEVPYYNNYLVYGKKFNGLKDIATKLGKLKNYNYKNKVMEINYTSRKGENICILLAIGLIVYSTEKDLCYLIGENYSKKNLHTIINISRITDIKETTLCHDCFHSSYYENLFDYMFSISIKTPVNVKVEFERIGNIERKITYLSKQRKYSTLTVEDEKIIYTDTVSVLSDFAAYLRKFGKSVRVIEPAILKEKLDFSVERTLARYQEVLTHEIS